MKLRVVVLGAGFGGLELSTILSEAISDRLDLTLIDRNAAKRAPKGGSDGNTTLRLAGMPRMGKRGYTSWRHELGAGSFA